MAVSAVLASPELPALMLDRSRLETVVMVRRKSIISTRAAVVAAVDTRSMPESVGRAETAASGEPAAAAEGRA